MNLCSNKSSNMIDYPTASNFTPVFEAISKQCSTEIATNEKDVFVAVKLAATLYHLSQQVHEPPNATTPLRILASLDKTAQCLVKQVAIHYYHLDDTDIRTTNNEVV